MSDFLPPHIVMEVEASLQKVWADSDDVRGIMDYREFLRRLFVNCGNGCRSLLYPPGGRAKKGKTANDLNMLKIHIPYTATAQMVAEAIWLYSELNPDCWVALSELYQDERIAAWGKILVEDFKAVPEDAAGYLLSLRFDSEALADAVHRSGYWLGVSNMPSFLIWYELLKCTRSNHGAENSGGTGALAAPVIQRGIEVGDTSPL